MSIKTRSLWIELYIPTLKFKRFFIPFPIFIFQELLDSALDVLTILSHWKKDFTYTKSKIPMNDIKLVVIMVMDLLDSITEDEPYDLVDVTTDEVSVRIRIR